MKIATVKLNGVSPYSQGRYHGMQKEDGETHEDHERRTWKFRLHVDENGEVFIPSMAFKNLLSETAKFLALKVKGEGKATYTKHFESGIMVMKHVGLGVTPDAFHEDVQFVPSDGQRGGKRRVIKIFPTIQPPWGCSVMVHVIDDKISREIFEKIWINAGKFRGLGRFRPANNGYYGRFEVDDIIWE